MTAQQDRPTTRDLVEVAAVAGRAPSVHNTQPWHWRAHDVSLDLYADRQRQLDVADPEGRMLLMSCGATLHHAQVALAAMGWATDVDRFGGPEHLARVTVTGPTAVTPEAMRLYQSIEVRRTDRRPVVEAPIAPTTFDELRRVVAPGHLGLHPLRPDDLAVLASAAAYANELGVDDPDQRAELAYWAGGARPTGTGIPDSALPDRPPRTNVPGRDFGHSGTLSVGAGHDTQATYAILHGPGDGPLDWLRAGEALSACWLYATELGVAVLPLTSVVELVTTRERLRRILSHVGYPYAVLRLGLVDAEHGGPAHTPRLPVDEIVDT